MSPLSPTSTAVSGQEAQVTDREYYSHTKCGMGVLDEWGIFLRDTDVAVEPTLAVDGFSQGNGGWQKTCRPIAIILSLSRVSTAVPHPKDF
jgi:hypothetical protein